MCNEIKRSFFINACYLGQVETRIFPIDQVAFFVIELGPDFVKDLINKIDDSCRP